ncbi:hypothetical protein D3C72_2004270 [compost metagenome]
MANRLLSPEIKAGGKILISSRITSRMRSSVISGLLKMSSISNPRSRNFSFRNSFSTLPIPGLSGIWMPSVCSPFRPASMDSFIWPRYI